MSAVCTVICDQPRKCACCGQVIEQGAPAVKHRVYVATHKSAKRRRLQGKPTRGSLAPTAGRGPAHRTDYYIPEHWAKQITGSSPTGKEVK